MKTGERIVRGTHRTVNRSIAVALCIAAENVAKLFLEIIFVSEFIVRDGDDGILCERRDLRSRS
jgi:uncharacterized metal-binding protein